MTWQDRLTVVGRIEQPTNKWSTKYHRKENMFPFSDLSKYESDKVTFKILKPWWDVITGYLLIFLLAVPILIGGMVITFDSFDCLPAVDCSFKENYTLSSGAKYRNVCTTFYRSQRAANITPGKTKTVVTDIKNRLQYAKYVNSECSKNGDLFASHFTLILFIEALVLVLLNSFWLKFPFTASITETFSALVVECYSSPGTNFALSRTAPVPDRNQTNASNGENPYRPVGADEPQDNRSASSKTSKQGEIFPDVATAVAVKTLFEKVKRFKEAIKSSKKIWRLYVAQATMQSVFSLVFFVIDLHCEKDLKGKINCTIDEDIPVVHDYFICSHNLARVFGIGFVVFLVLLGMSFAMFICTLVIAWSIKRRQDISEADKFEDLDFLLQLLTAYDKLYAVRFEIHMSEESGKNLNAFILESTWPVTRLKQCCEEDKGKKLKLSDLNNGIPQTLFDLSKLVTLKLTRCAQLHDDDFEHFDKLSKLTKLAVVKSGLTKIPEKIFKMTWLEFLILKQNSIKEIPDGISSLITLTTLNMNENRLKTISQSFRNLENLEQVYLSNNPDLGKSALQNVLPCQKLKKLTMSHNPFDQNDVHDKDRIRFETLRGIEEVPAKQ